MKLPAETEDYIPRWIALSLVDGNRRFYGIELPPVSPICFDTLEGVQLARDLPLSQLAVLTESSVRFIREINAAVERRETCFRAARNNTPLTHTLHVPKGWKEQTIKMLKSRCISEIDRRHNRMIRAALVTAGGVGVRMGSPIPKQYLGLNGIPVSPELFWLLRDIRLSISS